MLRKAEEKTPIPALPSVSVIIPTYNRADLVAQAVQSALDQAGVALEVVVVDDGSTDDTRHVLERFGGRIRYMVTENRGVAHARNTGMKASTGSYIAFLDSDDLYLPLKLALQVAFMEAHPDVGVVSTEMSGMIGEHVTVDRHLRSYHGIYNRRSWSYQDVYPVSGRFQCPGADGTIPFYKGSIFAKILQGQVLFTNTVLFNRGILPVVGYQNESYRTGEEYEYLVRICKHHKAAFLDVPTYIYRYHDQQVTMVASRNSRAKTLTEIETETVFLQAVLDWGFADKTFYDGHKDLVNRRIAELYHCIGAKWLEIGEVHRARESFASGNVFDPAYAPNRRGMMLSRVPAPIRGKIVEVSKRLQALGSGRRL